jgi:hypothetical protein
MECLLTNPKFQQYNKKIKEKSENAIKPFRSPQISEATEEIKWKNSHRCRRMTQRTRKRFVANIVCLPKERRVSKEDMFGDMVMEKLTGLKYWRIMKTKVMNGKQKFRSWG